MPGPLVIGFASRSRDHYVAIVPKNVSKANFQRAREIDSSQILESGAWDQLLSELKRDKILDIFFEFLIYNSPTTRDRASATLKKILSNLLKSIDGQQVLTTFKEGNFDIRHNLFSASGVFPIIEYCGYRRETELDGTKILVFDKPTVFSKEASQQRIGCIIAALDYFLVPGEGRSSAGRLFGVPHFNSCCGEIRASAATLSAENEAVSSLNAAAKSEISLEMHSLAAANRSATQFPEFALFGRSPFPRIAEKEIQWANAIKEYGNGSKISGIAFSIGSYMLGDESQKDVQRLLEDGQKTFVAITRGKYISDPRKVGHYLAAQLSETTRLLSSLPSFSSLHKEKLLELEAARIRCPNPYCRSTFMWSFESVDVLEKSYMLHAREMTIPCPNCFTPICFENTLLSQLHNDIASALDTVSATWRCKARVDGIDCNTSNLQIDSCCRICGQFKPEEAVVQDVELSSDFKNNSKDNISIKANSGNEAVKESIQSKYTGPLPVENTTPRLTNNVTDSKYESNLQSTYPPIPPSVVSQNGSHRNDIAGSSLTVILPERPAPVSRGTTVPVTRSEKSDVELRHKISIELKAQKLSDSLPPVSRLMRRISQPTTQPELESASSAIYLEDAFEELVGIFLSVNRDGSTFEWKDFWTAHK